MKYSVEYLISSGYYHHHSSYETLEEARELCKKLSSRKARIITIIEEIEKQEEEKQIIDPKYVNEKKVTKAVGDLVSKYFQKANIQVVKWDVKDDLMKFKKYGNLNGHEMTEAFLRACDRLGELVEEHEKQDLFNEFSICV